ncbi:hypothetical protein [Nostoc favosum]|uniref:pPIWI-RE three-gene island domain-containing protein n=1 Tax=Nostoc favosum CHAB5714 TaxID=2780399 RepID=A0ABS8II23_9NOSO|nr:hypothetical protein [Nostoc favosum]MCC5603783.1 hypothetical protein [Nostoc favosum CHAB5714]
MRETRSWRYKVTQSLQKQTSLHKDQIEALLDLELCLFAIEKLGVQSELETAISVWLLISNRFYLFPRLALLVETVEAKRTLFNLRQLVPYLTNQDVTEQLLKLYNQIPSKYRAYDVDDKTYRFTRKSMPSIWGNRFERFEELLGNKLKYRQRTVKYAEPGKEYRFRSGENTYSVRIPKNLPLCQGRVLSVHRENNKAISVTREEMESAANLLDEHCGQNHKGRLSDIILEHFQGMGFVELDTIVFDGVKNLVGLLNAGKSTLIEILTVAVAKRGHRVGIVFNEVVTCLRMASLLKKVGLRVSVVIGQRNRKVHLENWHSVDGGIDGFTHLSTACPLTDFSRHVEKAILRVFQTLIFPLAIFINLKLLTIRL